MNFMSALPRLFLGLVLLLALTACGSFSSRSGNGADYNAQRPSLASATSSEIVLFALGLMETGYRFGGKNPQAGLDCSGMVAYVFAQAAGFRVSGSAADIAARGRPVERAQLRPGDLVFFNTRNQPFSHVGIYIGEERFVHAPSTNGRVRIDHLNSTYYAARFEAARSFFD